MASKQLAVDGLLNAGGLKNTGVIVPAIVSGTTANWDPVGWDRASGVSEIQIGSNSSWTLTGLSRGISGRLVTITNVSPNGPILVTHEGSGSTAANRFSLAGGFEAATAGNGVSMAIEPGNSATFRYDGTLSRWRPVSATCILPGEYRAIAISGVADTSNYAISTASNSYKYIDWTFAGQATVTGLTASRYNAREAQLSNKNAIGSGYNLFLSSLDAGSSAANQFQLPYPTISIPPMAGVIVVYDQQYGKWYVASQSSPNIGAVSRGNGQAIPAPGNFLQQTGYVPAAVFLADDFGTSMVDSVANQALPAAGIPLYRRWNKNLRCVQFNTDDGGFGADLFAPANASMAVVGAFSFAASAGAARGIWGYRDSVDITSVYAYLDNTSGQVKIQVEDPTEAHFGTISINHTLVFGDVYTLCYHVNQTTNFVYARLINQTTGVAYDGTALNIALFNAFTGTGTPRFNVGYFPGAYGGNGLSVYGVAVVTTGVEGTDVAAKLATRMLGA